MLFQMLSNAWTKHSNAQSSSSFKQNIFPFSPPEALIIVLLFFLALTVSFRYLNLNSAVKPSFYQTEFAPAVLQTCGLGFKQPAIPISELTQFLYSKTYSFNCESLPANLPTVLPDRFQSFEYYLLASFAILWKVFGINWQNTFPLFIFFYCVTCISAYGIFRFGMNKGLSVFFTLGVIFSPLHLSYLPLLRDYSVAPFALFSIYLLITLVKKPRAIKTIYKAAALIGMILGVGMGFRTDIMVFIPLFLISSLFLTCQNHKLRILDRIIICSIFLASFIIIAWPILKATSQGGIAHVILLGLYDPFTKLLGLENTIYNLGTYYDDLFALLAVNRFATQVDHQSFAHLFFNHNEYDLSAYYSDESLKIYTHYVGRYLWEYVKLFPADIIMRWFASVSNVLSLSFYHPNGFLNQLFVAPLQYYGMIFSLICALFSVIFLSFYQLRLGIFSVTLIGYVAAYSVLQFEGRHFFYLEFINLWCIGFLLQRIFHIKHWRYKTKFLSVFYFLMLLILPTTTLTWAACRYQTHHLRELISRVIKSPTLPLTFTTKNNLLQIQDVARNDLFASTVLKMEVTHCSLSQFILKHIYNINIDVAAVATFNNNITIFFPTFRTPKSKFLGLYLFPYPSACQIKISQVIDSTSLPISLFLQLPDNWKHMTLYQYPSTRSVEFPANFSFGQALNDSVRKWKKIWRAQKKLFINSIYAMR